MQRRGPVLPPVIRLLLRHLLLGVVHVLARGLSLLQRRRMLCWAQVLWRHLRGGLPPRRATVRGRRRLLLVGMRGWPLRPPRAATAVGKVVPCLLIAATTSRASTFRPGTRIGSRSTGRAPVRRAVEPKECCARVASPVVPDASATARFVCLSARVPTSCATEDGPAAPALSASVTCVVPAQPSGERAAPPCHAVVALARTTPASVRTAVPAALWIVTAAEVTTRMPFVSAPAKASLAKTRTTAAAICSVKAAPAL